MHEVLLKIRARCFIAPIQGDGVLGGCDPRAVPWAFILQPFRRPKSSVSFFTHAVVRYSPHEILRAARKYEPYAPRIRADKHHEGQFVHPRVSAKSAVICIFELLWLRPSAALGVSWFFFLRVFRRFARIPGFLEVVRKAADRCCPAVWKSFGGS